MITKTLIENFRETVKPVVSQLLFGVNYEGMGTLDCEEFERDFDEILDLALAGYEQKVNNAVSTLDGNKGLEDEKKAIEALPPAQPEPHEGEWINTNPEYKNGFYNNSYYCSECHDYYTTSPYEMKFCPNCGAKMKGETT